VGPFRSISPESQDERDARGLAGRLASPPRDRDALRVAATHLEHWLRARGVSGDPRLPAALIGRLRAGRAPLVHHLLALEEVSHAGVYACLRILGYDLEDLPLLQAVLHRDRTVMLSTTSYDRERPSVWPAAFTEHVDLSRGEFVSELVSRFDSYPAPDLADGAAASRFVHLRIGRFDTDLTPSVVPGSIVRVDTGDCGPARFNPRAQRGGDRPVYAVAHLRGLSCAYVDWIGEERIALIPHHHRRAPTIYRLQDEAVVLGRVCTELRPMDVEDEPNRRRGHTPCASRLVRPDADRQPFGAFLRSSREAIGMTHRDAHAVSVRIAEVYNDRRFAIGIGTLSDWESQRELPLSVPHLVSLAACYAVSFTDLLRASRLLSAPRLMPSERRASAPDRVDASLFQPALWPAVQRVGGLQDLSWDDVFRCGDGATAFDRVLVGARYLIVNRRVRNVTRATSALVDRPLYILSDECGRQICAGCFVDRDRLYIQPDPLRPPSIRALACDRVTIRGRVTAILRCR
jgi:hypothetical protein